MATNKTVIVEQIGSPIRREASQRATLIGLGLNKRHRRSELKDTPDVRGMIHKVRHLVRIVEGEQPKTTNKKVEGEQPKTTNKKVEGEQPKTTNNKAEDKK